MNWKKKFNKKCCQCAYDYRGLCGKIAVMKKSLAEVCAALNPPCRPKK